MNQVSLFSAALGLAPLWQVVDVRFDPKGGRIDFEVACTPGTRFTCPHCGGQHQPVRDTLERKWLGFGRQGAVRAA